MRKIGLHVRLNHSLTDMIEQALRLKMDFFQCFMVLQGTGTIFTLDDFDVQSYLKLRREHFGDLYMHGSYWINLASISFAKHYSLQHELAMAKKLEFTHMVLHPGSAKGAQSKLEGIDAMARIINATLRTENSVKLVIENGAFGALSVGGDLIDFQLFLTKLDHPEKVLFCIDTAHAHSYGYNLIGAQAQNDFIALLDSTIGINNISLLHLNDTNELCGSKTDRHAVMGQGALGQDVLREFAMHEKLKHIPLLMELPTLSEDEELIILDKVRSWQK
jgi:deoxyribonuclease-4